jgi:hypothetical protein
MLKMIAEIASFWKEGLFTPDVNSLVISAMPAFLARMAGGLRAIASCRNTNLTITILYIAYSWSWNVSYFLINVI